MNDRANRFKGKVLVPGPVRTGTVTCAGVAPCNDAILVVDCLRSSHYSQIVRARAVICEACEPTSHIAVVCRIVGVPMIVLADALRHVSPGQRVSVDGLTGVVTEGSMPRAGNTTMGVKCSLSARCRFQVSIVPMPDLIQRVNALGRANVAQFFLREEFIWVERNVGPFAFFHDHGSESVTGLLVDSLIPLMRTLQPGQVLNFRSLDLRSDQAAEFDPLLEVERNPHLGLHGIRQLLVHPDYLVAELRAVDCLYDRGLHNIIFSVPFLALEAELESVLALRKQVCRNEVRIGVFVETPAAVTELPFLLRRRPPAVYLGTKDLAQLILAADRDNGLVAHILNPCSRPVIEAIRSVVAQCCATDTPLFVFTLLDDLSRLKAAIPELEGFSLPASDYLRMFGCDPTETPC